MKELLRASEPEPSESCETRLGESGEVRERFSRRHADDLPWRIDRRTPGARLVVLYVGLTFARSLSVAKSRSSLSNPLSGWSRLARGLQ
jgi:hypothetical protein